MKHKNIKQAIRLTAQCFKAMRYSGPERRLRPLTTRVLFDRRKPVPH